MRHGGSAGATSTYTLRLAEDVYPNQPNVRRYTVELNAALFADPRFTVTTIGPFVLAIRKSGPRLLTTETTHVEQLASTSVTPVLDAAERSDAEERRP